MTVEQLQELKEMVGGMRFMQASSLVAAGLNDNKQAEAYMRKLAKLDAVLTTEITERLNDSHRQD